MNSVLFFKKRDASATIPTETNSASLFANSSERLSVKTSAGNTYPLVISGSGDSAIIGDPGSESSGINIGGVTYESTLKVSDIDGTNFAQTILHRHSTTLEPLIVGARTNSNTSSHANVTASQGLFSIYAAGYAGSNYKLAGSITIGVDSTGSISNTSLPGRMVFSITPNGTVTPEAWLTVSNDKSAIFTGDVTFSGDITVNGTTTTINTVNLIVEDKNITINHGGTTAGTIGAGINIEGDAAAIVGYIRVNASDNTLLEFKSPGGNIATLDVNADKTLTIAGALNVSGDSTINQNVSTTGSPTHAGVTLTGLTASQLTATNASKTLVSLSTATYPSLTEVSYVKGVTSALQTQLNAKAASGANTDITSVYLNNTGLKVKDTDSSHGLSIVPGSNLTANRTLTVTTGDASRTITLSGNTTLDDWFDQSVKTTASPTFANLTLTGGTVTLSADTNFVTSGGTNGFSVDTDTLSVDGANNRVGFGTTTPIAPIGLGGSSAGRQISVRDYGLSNDHQYEGIGRDTNQIIYQVSGSTVDTVWRIGTGSSTSVEAMRLYGGGGLTVGSAPTGGNKGAGTINMSGDIYKNNSAYTNPDYVLEMWATGKIEKFKNNPGAKGYKLPSIDEIEKTSRSTFRLPGMTDKPMGTFGRQDWLLEKLEEAFVCIFELQKQIKVLEKKLSK